MVTRRATRRFDSDQRADPALPDPKLVAEILARKPKSLNNRNSRYTQGGDVEVFDQRLGWWERIIFEPADDDIPITISPDFDKRPDLLAKAIYGKQQLAWVILQFNNILDINTEFIAGKEITVPSEARVLIDLLNRPTGVGLEPQRNNT